MVKLIHQLNLTNFNKTHTRTSSSLWLVRNCPYKNRPPGKW